MILLGRALQDARSVLSRGVRKDDLSSPNVGSPVSFNFSNVCQTTDRESEELAIQGSRNTFSNASFTHSRRSNETNNLSFDRSTKFTNGEELKDAIFDIR